MRQITVISGKGGTGKTSIIAALSSLADTAVLADCDVDAADLHIILNPDVQRAEEFSGGRVAVIRKSQCTQCGACRELCRFDAIGGSLAIDPIACEGCGVCAAFCPEKAITMMPKLSGHWFVSETRNGPMVHARLGIAEDNSGKLVSQVRNEAKQLAEARGLDFVIVDGPPGIGCPVIAAIAGVDLVLVVTEPTLSGLHDLERVLATAGHFNIPAAVCVNKFDINPRNTTAIEDLCSRQSVPVVARIPYDRSVVAALLQKQTVLEHEACAAVADEIRQMWGRISALTAGKGSVA
ncbi:MAG: (4Fe-4S)-binding protein [Deltaproteobacteria bacterium]|nr:(4Fe-4S)-binding protein [Deltaproteobacteria bacterium]